MKAFFFIKLGVPIEVLILDKNKKSINLAFVFIYLFIFILVNLVEDREHLFFKLLTKEIECGYSMEMFEKLNEVIIQQSTF